MPDNLQEPLYQGLCQALLSGVYVPGERLKIRDLAAQWGTSAMPVRAVLQRLVAEGALEGAPQRSVRVPLMTAERYQHIAQVRISLEGLAVELATPRLHSAQLSQLAQCLERMQEAIAQRQLAAYLQANSEFHLSLYRACGNPVLLRSIETLWLQVGPFFTRLFNAAQLDTQLNDFHGQCLAAIHRGDAQGARQAMEQDLIYFTRFLLKRLEHEQ
ncbi:GntR family transcriptional regulator [Pseudomonas sp. 5P_3.1_Bac2]|uniref:GntR family transcriptional regulator n=1 Tax=Pseudomonas sp. 5P_3.1_Bac2 TaxID=2971617 RepID=UPI0021C58965|nr:GntR family transcriptional regulator [Pseudomonas sp. 5P_3.1_Bac2]MCU1719193.1 GntR family transcriptional regulator [Pseudomonas sp. 5P_3.1_Bac2]